MIILGVDPGSQRTGYGVIQTDGHQYHLLTHGAIVAPPRQTLPVRLATVHEGLRTVISAHRPDVLAVEDIFHSANTRSALVLGHVRGVILLAGAQAGLPIQEFPPATVKVQVTGYGRAEKSQVALMVARILGIPSIDASADASDALAVAICQAVLSRPGMPVA